MDLLIDDKDYPLSDYYVGDLYITYKLGNLLTGEHGENELEKKNEYQNAIRNGALKYQNGNIITDLQNRLEYLRILTIFLMTDNGVLCLHNGKVYKEDDHDFILTPRRLNDFLQVSDRIRYKEIDFSQALRIYKRLFCTKDVPIIHSNRRECKLTDFYIGILYLSEYNLLTQTSLAVPSIRQMLINRSINLGLYTNESIAYSQFRTIFEKDGDYMLNLHNNGYYNVNDKYSLADDNISYHKDHCSYLNPLSEYLSNDDQKSYKILTPQAAYSLFPKCEDNLQTSIKRVKTLKTSINDTLSSKR